MLPVVELAEFPSIPKKGISPTSNNIAFLMAVQVLNPRRAIKTSGKRKKDGCAGKLGGFCLPESGSPARVGEKWWVTHGVEPLIKSQTVLDRFAQRTIAQGLPC
jgi:hypothetical protein